MTEFIVSMGQVRVEAWLCVYFGLIAAGISVGFFSRSKSIYSAWFATASGLLFAAFLAWETLSEKALAFLLALVVALWGGSFLALSGALALGRRARRKKRLREEKKRRVEFLLPDEKNEYLRSRLSTALKTREEERSETGVRLEYVRILLAKLKAAPLIAVERLQIEELARQITLYSSKEGLTAEEQRALGDCFSQLLKTAAKYGV